MWILGDSLCENYWSIVVLRPGFWSVVCHFRSMIAVNISHFQLSYYNLQASSAAAANDGMFQCALENWDTDITCKPGSAIYTIQKIVELEVRGIAAVSSCKKHCFVMQEALFRVPFWGTFRGTFLGHLLGLAYLERRIHVAKCVACKAATRSDALSLT